MDWFNIITQFYKDGLWDDKMVANAVLKNKISKEEYTAIIND